MPLICIGPVCIPITALLPIIALLLRPIYWVLPQPAQRKCDEFGVWLQGWLDWMTPSFLKFGKKKCDNTPRDTSARTPVDAFPLRPGKIFELEDEDQMHQLYEAAQQADGAVLAYYTASWCGPCKKIKPTVEAIAREAQSSLQVVQVDADEFSGAGWYKAVSLPYFELVSGDKKMGSLHIASDEKLRKMVDDVLKKED
eukprot:TRINITY_DN10738_c0_g1_i1.p1 TRINITY_DN10738_c0_g1~~TRINITY_DN10738_c0_g1_i1.p1  ORF type:complete len:228 (+),score=98.98 TRINITY_DN10738_c0_g1_i1:93-686(+)